MTSYNLHYAQGEVNARTTGLFDAMQPMRPAKKTYWRTNTSFIYHPPSYLKPSIKNLKGKYKSIITSLKEFYYWEGGIPVSEPIICYEHERCTVTVTWDGKLWTSKASKEWVPPTSVQNSFQEADSYVCTDKAIKFTHTFDGPKLQPILFNRLVPVLRGDNLYFNMFGSPIYFWFNCSKLFPMDGVFAVASERFAEI
ncbi:hypothetical protein DSO57_1029255 [Entomophthora muscae]|uniref:Uncharacterized protein n=1 Tax=Entomophthora muscae TaxID=34485 RepID=A0ACC2RS71_9FUNG|nr:hypothetical protein DSO57_1029255 [Entomophthora muscae]